MVRTTRPEKRASSNGVFLHCDLRSAGSSTQGVSGSITITSAGEPARSEPPGRPSNSAGRVDIARISVLKSISPLWTSRKAAGSMVCRPTAPEAASANGSRFTSTSCGRSEEHTSELQSRLHLVCRLLLEKKKKENDSSYIFRKLKFQKIKI